MMKSTGIVAFCGSKGAGKSTSYNIFKSFYHGDIEEVALAGHLKEVCAKVFKLDMELFTNPDLKEKELDRYINVRAPHVEAIFQLFDVREGTIYDEHIRPHIGVVFETPRKLLQYVGTEILRPIDPEIHVKLALKKKNPNKLTVVTDLRFPNEFNYLKDNMGEDFTSFYVKNSRAEIIASQDAHPSERGLHEFKEKCTILPNDTSLSELKRRICLLVGDLFKEN